MRLERHLFTFEKKPEYGHKDLQLKVFTLITYTTFIGVPHVPKAQVSLPRLNLEALQTGRDLSNSHSNVHMDGRCFGLNAGYIYICPGLFSVILILLLLNC